VRFEYHKRFFRNAGRAFFSSKDHSQELDDSVTNEEKEKLLRENEEFQSNSNPYTNENLKEFAENLSVQLNKLRIVLQDALKNPKSNEWVESTLSILASTVTLVHNYGYKELEKVLINIARILLSADRVGKAELIIDKFYVLYTKLSIVIAELFLGKTQDKIFEGIWSLYNNIVQELEKMGIKLITDDEELIGQISEEVHQNKEVPISEQTNQAITPPVEKTEEKSIPPNYSESPSNNLDYSQISQPKPPSETISPISIQSVSEHYQSEEARQVPPTQPELDSDPKPFSTSFEPQNPNVPEELDDSIPTASPIPETSDTEIHSVVEKTPTFTEELSKDNTSLDNSHKSIIQTSFSSLLSNIKNETIINKFEATLKALAENSPELAKEKAIELAIEIANLEIEEIKKQQKVLELQIESLKSDIEQTDINIHESVYEKEEITKELQAQEKQIEDILNRKQTSEFELSKINAELKSIEEQIAILLKKKEETIAKINDIQKNLEYLDKDIEENNQNLISIKETLSDVDNKISILNEKKSSLLSELEKRQNTLNELSEQIRKKEDTLIKLSNSLDLIKFSNQNKNDNSLSLEGNQDLFSGGAI